MIITRFALYVLLYFFCVLQSVNPHSLIFVGLLRASTRACFMVRSEKACQCTSFSNAFDETCSMDVYFSASCIQWFPFSCV